MIHSKSYETKLYVNFILSLQQRIHGTDAATMLQATRPCCHPGNSVTHKRNIYLHSSIYYNTILGCNLQRNL